MGKRDAVKRVLVALAMMLAVGAAEAQRKRMPVRSEPIPDTESGRPAASATFKGKLLIYGPQSLPVTPPREHVKPATEAPAVAAPAPKPEPAPAPVAAPASRPEPAPAPVVTAVPAPPPPVAAPIPAAPPPAPVAAPAPTSAPAPAPIAEPKPAPAPPPPPVAAPAPPPAPTVATPAAPSKREPIVRPEAVARPEPAPAAAPSQDLALAAPSGAAAPAPGAPVPIEMKLIESIFTCLAPGLPQDWKKAWIEITDPGSGKEKASKFFFTNLRGDEQGEPLVPCNAQELTRRILSLNEKLPPDRRAWTRALLVIDSEGDYELSYEYPK